MKALRQPVSIALLLAGLATGFCASPGLAQPVDLPIPPAATTDFPAGIKVIKTPSGPVYADQKGQTLYGMDMRTLIRWGADPAQYCQSDCAKDWVPVLAPKDAQPNIMFPRGFGELRLKPGTPPPPLPAGFVQPQRAPDWTVIAGPAGPQWVYKGWHMVFTRKGEKRGSTAFDGAENKTWNTLKFVPPVPAFVAPGEIGTTLVNGNWAMTDKEGHVLFTGTSPGPCQDWHPLPAAMASRGVADWTVSNQGDRPQWLFKGKPVFVSQNDDPAIVPQGAVVLRP